MRLSSASGSASVPPQAWTALDVQASRALDQDLDAADPGGAELRARFAPGSPGTLYFDANSIGPMPVEAPARMQQVLEEGWRLARRRSWNESDWLAQPRAIGDMLAPALGARSGDVVVCDSTSINQFKLLRYALELQGKPVIVAERDVFPSNLYVAEGIARFGHAKLRLIGCMEELPEALAPGDVAVVALSHVDYRSSTRLDIHSLSARIHDAGALSLWDLSHSAGALNVDLRASGADFALGCGYKYLSGGPGAPSFIYVHPRHQHAGWPAICGWMGHADTFAFDAQYQPADGVGRFQVGTPAVLANAAMSAAAHIWREVDPVQLESRHRSLSNYLIQLVQGCELAGELSLASPADHSQRGGHVAFRFDGAQALAQGLIAAGVVVSARKPDALRFGIHPLVTRNADLWEAVQRLRKIIQSGSWRDPRFGGAQV